MQYHFIASSCKCYFDFNCKILGRHN